MNNKNWLQIIEENNDAVVAYVKDVYKESLYARHLRFIVEIDKDGKLESWTDVAGGNAMSADVFNKESIVLIEFCHQDMHIEVGVIDYIAKALKHGLVMPFDYTVCKNYDAETIRTWVAETEPNGLNEDDVIEWFNDKYPDLEEELENDWLAEVIDVNGDNFIADLVEYRKDCIMQDYKSLI